MELTTTDIDGLITIKPKVYDDRRGFFLESKFATRVQCPKNKHGTNTQIYTNSL